MTNIDFLLSAEHPHYCDENNCLSNYYHFEHSSMTFFLEEVADDDPEYDLVFRYDVKEFYGRIYVEVCILQQKGGLYTFHRIDSMTEEEAGKFIEFLKVRWKVIQQLWTPFSGVKNEI